MAYSTGFKEPARYSERCYVALFFKSHRRILVWDKNIKRNLVQRRREMIDEAEGSLL